MITAGAGNFRYNLIFSVFSRAKIFSTEISCIIRQYGMDNEWRTFTGKV